MSKDVMKENYKKVLKAKFSLPDYRIPFERLNQVIDQNGPEMAGEIFTDWASNMPNSWQKKSFEEAGKMLMKNMPVSNALKPLRIGELKNTDLLDKLEAVDGFDYKGNSAVTYMSNIDFTTYDSFKRAADGRKQTHEMGADNGVDYGDDAHDGYVPSFLIPGDAPVNPELMKLFKQNEDWFEGLSPEMMGEVKLRAQGIMETEPNTHASQAVLQARQELTARNTGNPMAAGPNEQKGRDNIQRYMQAGGKVGRKNPLQKPAQYAFLGQIIDNISGDKDIAPYGWNVEEARPNTREEGIRAGLVPVGAMRDIHGSTAGGTGPIEQATATPGLGALRGYLSDTTGIDYAPRSLAEAAASGRVTSDEARALVAAGYIQNEDGTWGLPTGSVPPIGGANADSGTNVSVPPIGGVSADSGLGTGISIDGLGSQRGYLSDTTGMDYEIPQESTNTAAYEEAPENVQALVNMIKAGITPRSLGETQLRGLGYSPLRIRALLGEDHPRAEGVGVIPPRPDTAPILFSGVGGSDVNVKQEAEQVALGRAQLGMSNGSLTQAQAEAQVAEALGVSKLKARSLLGAGPKKMGESAAELAAKRQLNAGNLIVGSGGVRVNPKQERNQIKIASNVPEGSQRIADLLTGDGGSIVQTATGEIMVATPDGLRPASETEKQEIIKATSGDLSGGQISLNDNLVDTVRLNELLGQGNTLASAVGHLLDGDDLVAGDTASSIAGADSKVVDKNISETNSSNTGGAQSGNATLDTAIDKATNSANSADQLLANLSKEIDRLGKESDKAFNQSIMYGIAAYGLTMLTGGNFDQSMKMAEFAMKVASPQNKFIERKLKLYEGVYGKVKLQQLESALGVSGSDVVPSALEKKIKYIDNMLAEGKITEEQHATAVQELLNPGAAAVIATAGKEQAKADQDAADADYIKWEAANNSLIQYQTLSNLMDQIQTGQITGSELLITTKAALQNLGIDVQVDNEQAARNVIAQLLVAERSKLRGQGTITDNETRMLENTLPSLQNTPAANKMIIYANQQSNRRIKEIYEAWNNLTADERREVGGYQKWKVNFIKANQKRWETDFEAGIKQIQRENDPKLLPEDLAATIRRNGTNPTPIYLKNGTVQMWVYKDDRIIRIR